MILGIMQAVNALTRSASEGLARLSDLQAPSGREQLGGVATGRLQGRTVQTYASIEEPSSVEPLENKACEQHATGAATYHNVHSKNYPNSSIAEGEGQENAETLAQRWQLAKGARRACESLIGDKLIAQGRMSRNGAKYRAATAELKILAAMLVQRRRDEAAAHEAMRRASDQVRP